MFHRVQIKTNDFPLILVDLGKEKESLNSVNHLRIQTRV